MTSAWLDPEFWGPRGLGCWECTERPADLVLDRIALCIRCFARRFPGRNLEAVWDWVMGQVDAAEDRMARRAAWEAERARRLREGLPLET